MAKELHQWRVEPAKKPAERMGECPTWYVYRNGDRECTVVMWRTMNREFVMRFHKAVSERDLKYIEIFCSTLRKVYSGKCLNVEVIEDDA